MLDASDIWDDMAEVSIDDDGFPAAGSDGWDADCAIALEARMATAALNISIRTMRTFS
jgi:hypothetical protein